MVRNDQDWSGMTRTGQEGSGMVRNDQDLSGMTRTGQEGSRIVRNDTETFKYCLKFQNWMKKS